MQRTCDHIIASVERSGSVRRVVVTSSVAAVISEADINELVRRPVCDEDRYPDESNPKRTPERGQGYSMGKVIAQRAFSDAAARSGDWDAITVCPADNVGPIQSAHQKDGGPWQHLIERMLQGRCEIFQGTGPYRPWMTVDVRDDAACHIGLLESDRVANGERYIAWSTETPRLRGHLHDDRPGAARAAPRPGSDRRRHAGAPEGPRGRVPRRSGPAASCATTASAPCVPITFRPLDDSIRDCVESLLAVAHVEPNRRPD